MFSNFIISIEIFGLYLDNLMIISLSKKWKTSTLCFEHRNNPILHRKLRNIVCMADFFVPHHSTGIDIDCSDSCSTFFHCMFGAAPQCAYGAFILYAEITIVMEELLASIYFLDISLDEFGQTNEKCWNKISLRDTISYNFHKWSAQN